MPPEDDDQPISMTDLAGLLAGIKEDDTVEAAPEQAAPTAEPAAAESSDDTPEQGTGAGDERSGEGDEQEAETPEPEPSTDPLYTVKIGDTSEQITLAEALRGYQRQADYTRKTSELAVERQAIESEKARARQERERYAQVLGVIQERLGPADGEPTVEQWNALAQADPTNYAAKWADYQRREQQRANVRQEQERINREKEREFFEQSRVQLEGERGKLIAALPVFGDDEKAPGEMKALRDYAVKVGKFTEAEVDLARDHRVIVLLDKARKWDNHQAALVKAKGKIEQAAPLPNPSARQPVNGSKVAARKAAQEKFNRTGNIDDAVSLLLS